MNDRTQSLPRGFEALQPHVEFWAADSAAGRAGCRLESTPAQRQVFYDAVNAQLSDALAYLDQQSPREFDAAEQNLMNLLLSFAHVSLAVEIQKDDEPKQAQVRKYMTITQCSADF